MEKERLTLFFKGIDYENRPVYVNTVNDEYWKDISFGNSPNFLNSLYKTENNDFNGEPLFSDLSALSMGYIEAVIMSNKRVIMTPDDIAFYNELRKSTYQEYLKKTHQKDKLESYIQWKLTCCGIKKEELAMCEKEYSPLSKTIKLIEGEFLYGNTLLLEVNGKLMKRKVHQDRFNREYIVIDGKNIGYENINKN